MRMTNLAQLKSGRLAEAASPAGAVVDGRPIAAVPPPFYDPASLLGAVLYAVLFALAAWVMGRALRLAIHRILAYDKRALMDRTTVQFLGQLAQMGFISWRSFPTPTSSPPWPTSEQPGWPGSASSPSSSVWPPRTHWAT